MRAVAVFAWSVGLVHLLAVAGQARTAGFWAPGHLLLVLTGVVSAFTAIVAASLVLFSPGDAAVDAVRQALLGGAAPGDAGVAAVRSALLGGAVPLPPKPTGGEVSLRRRLNLHGPAEHAVDASAVPSPKASPGAGAGAGDGGELVSVSEAGAGAGTPPGSVVLCVDDALGEGESSAAVKEAAPAPVATPDAVPLPPAAPERSTPGSGSHSSKGSTGAAVPESSTNSGSNESHNVDELAGWQDVIVGITGMAEALAEANNSVSVVALNSDLTVSLSTLLLNTLKLFDSEPGGRSTIGSVHLGEPHADVNEICSMAAPIFDTGTPLVLYNKLAEGKHCFFPRDTFSCCLYALLYRAGTRIAAGDCVMWTEGVEAPPPPPPRDRRHCARPTEPADQEGEPEPGRQLSVDGSVASAAGRSLISSDGGDGGRGGAGAGAGSVELVRVMVEYAAATQPDPGPDPGSGSAPAGAAAKEAAQGGESHAHTHTTELRFWERCLKEVGGTLAFEVLAGAATHTERIVMTVPTHGSDTFFDPVGSPTRHGDRPSHKSSHGGDDSGTRSLGGGGSARSSGAGASDGGRPPGMRTGARRTSTWEEAGAAPPHPAFKFSILYIEDERVQAYFFTSKCKRVFGDQCVVVHEADGVTALERLHRGEQFNIIISDVFMTGMDGVSFFRALFSSHLGPTRCAAEGELRVNLILTGAAIEVESAVGAADEELADELGALSRELGVLVYSKLAGVDVIQDVIKPRVAFFQMHLKLSALPHPRGSQGGGGSGGGGDGGNGGVGGGGGGAGEVEWWAPRHMLNDVVPESGSHPLD